MTSSNTDWTCPALLELIYYINSTKRAGHWTFYKDMITQIKKQITGIKASIQGQSISEYLILIAIVIAAVVAMQTYARRGIQAVVKLATDDIGLQNEVFSKSADMYSQTTTEFGGSCSQVGGTCSSVAGAETTTEGIPYTDAIALQAKGINVGSVYPIPLTQAEYNAINTTGLPAVGKVFYYTTPTTNTSSSTQSIQRDEQAGGIRYTGIITDTSSSNVTNANDGSTTLSTIYYEKE